MSILKNIMVLSFSMIMLFSIISNDAFAAIPTSVNIYSDLKSLHEGREITFQGQIAHRSDGGIPKGVPNTNFVIVETISEAILASGTTSNEGTFKVSVIMKNYNGNDDQVIKAIHTGSGNYERSESNTIDIYVYSSEAIVASQEKAEAEQAQKEAERLKLQAEQAEKEAEQAQKEAEQAKEIAKIEQDEAEKAKDEISAVLQEAEKAKDEISAVLQEAEKAKDKIDSENQQFNDNVNTNTVPDIVISTENMDTNYTWLAILVVIPIAIIAIVVKKRSSKSPHQFTQQGLDEVNESDTQLWGGCPQCNNPNVSQKDGKVTCPKCGWTRN